MKEHKVREMKPEDNPATGDLVYWVELESDRWLPLKEIPTHDAIHSFLDDEKKRGKHTISFATRAFRIGIIQGKWTKLEPIK